MRMMEKSVIALFIYMAPGFWVAPVMAEDTFSTHRLTSQNAALEWDRLATSDPCVAQALPDKPWTLLDVVQRALCHNPQTRQAWANARFQAEQVGVNQAAYLPSVTLSATASRNATTSFTNTGIPIQNQLRPTLSLNYLLFDFGGREARLESARRSLDAANWTHDATLQTVLLAAAQGYYQLFGSQAAVDAARETERSSAEALEAAMFRRKVGAATLADELQARTAWSQALLNRQQTEGNARIAQGTLNNVLGLDAGYSLQVAPPFFSAPDNVQEQNLATLIEEAKRLRPDLAAAQAQVEAQSANIKVAQASGMPNLSFTTNYGRIYSDVFPNAQSWSLGFSLNVPLFTGFSTTYQVRGAQRQLEAQQANRDKLETQVSLDVWRAYYTLATARDTLDSSQALLTSAMQSADVALGRYKAGAGNILDLLTAQAALANARQQNIQNRYNWHIAKAALAQAMGRLDLPDLATILPVSSPVNDKQE